MVIHTQKLLYLTKRNEYTCDTVHLLFADFMPTLHPILFLQQHYLILKRKL